MLKISNYVSIPSSEIELIGIRAQGAGGQNVNKVSTAIHLRFDIHHSSLPDHYKERLKKVNDYRITADGVINIKAQRYNSQPQNKDDALKRLAELIQKAIKVNKSRKATKPTKGSVKKRLDSKTKRGQIKKLRDKRF